MLASWAVQAPDNAPKRLQDPIPWNFYVEGTFRRVDFEAALACPNWQRL